MGKIEAFTTQITGTPGNSRPSHWQDYERLQSTFRCSRALRVRQEASVASPKEVAEQAGSDEIVVTARKHEEYLQNVPVSVTAIRGE